MDILIKWVLGVGSVLFCGAIFAIVRLFNSKANKIDLIDAKTIVTQEDLKNNLEKFEKKFEITKTEGDRQYRELKVSIEVLQKELTLLDKHSLTSNDLTDVKNDIKELVRGQNEMIKIVDDVPNRVKSLEATRNKQSEN